MTGYDLHITRESDWPLRGNDITLDEWLAVVANDLDLSLEGEFALWRTQNGRTVRDSSLAEWRVWSRRERGEMARFDLNGGNVNCKNPDEEIRRKMWRIAQQLNARVQGDDGEFYDEFGNGAYEELPPMRPEESAYALPPLRAAGPQGKKTIGWLTRLLASWRRRP